MNRWKDWYEQGKRNRERALLDLKYEYYEWTCFTAQQAAEMVVKSIALKLGLTIWGHSLTEMFKILSQKIDISEKIKDDGKLLDLYYIPPRYPNGFSAGKPADYFTKKQAKGAINATDSIIRFCESLLFGQDPNTK